ncbi:MAG TPA: P1 family peptidase [Rhodothermales bacterium]|nr:P1 family peptidase [Rhodothermales bacterium]
MTISVVLALSAAIPDVSAQEDERFRFRALDMAPGVLPTGLHNAITDVDGVSVGHFTWHEGTDIHTGVTAIIPHPGNVFQDKVPAAVAIGNAFGKLAGSTQIEELGEIETPILLTNTLSVAQALDALVQYTLALPGNEDVRSINAVVGETNDGYLNDIRRRVLVPQHFLEAITNASSDPPAEGSVGAGAGTIAFGWKGGIGTSSRMLPAALGGYTVGVLVQSNYGGILQIMGVPIGVRLGQYFLRDHVESPNADGSIMIVVATDAPLSDRNLKRLAHRALAGLARTGSAMSNGSGDYVIAFSTAESVRRTPHRRTDPATITELPNNRMSPLFQAVIEATEEAIYNSLFMATTVNGFGGTVKALPLDRVKTILE